MFSFPHFIFHSTPLSFDSSSSRYSTITDYYVIGDDLTVVRMKQRIIAMAKVFILFSEKRSLIQLFLLRQNIGWWTRHNAKLFQVWNQFCWTKFFTFSTQNCLKVLIKPKITIQLVIINWWNSHKFIHLPPKPQQMWKMWWKIHVFTSLPT